MQKLYREARQGKLETQEATRLVFILMSISKLIEQSDFEERLKKLEASLGQNPR